MDQGNGDLSESHTKEVSNILISYFTIHSLSWISQIQEISLKRKRSSALIIGSRLKATIFNGRQSSKSKKENYSNCQSWTSLKVPKIINEHAELTDI